MADENERYAQEVIPSDYASWRYCIERKCGLALTPAFLQARISILGDPQHEETRRFEKLYGRSYRERILGWYQRAAAEG